MAQEQVTERPQAEAEPAAEVERLQTQVVELEAERVALRERLALAVAKYRVQLLASAPEVPEEMVVGGSVEVVDAAFAAARDLVERVRRKLEAQAVLPVREGRIPAGAPARSAADLSGLSPREKIAHALSREAR